MYKKAHKRYDNDKYEKHYSYCKKYYSPDYDCKKYDEYKKHKDYNNEYDYELIGCYLEKHDKYYGCKKHDGYKY